MRQSHLIILVVLTDCMYPWCRAGHGHLISKHHVENKQDSMSENQVRVVVRVKPDTSQEDIFEYAGFHSCSINGSEFSFDKIFSPKTSQKELFLTHFNEDVDNVLQGFNSTIIAFGQTAAGKSYTMTGGDTRATEGLIPRAVRRIFENECQFLTASYVEIHNEKVRDLFNSLSPVSMLGDGTLKDAKLITAESPQQVMKKIDEGNKLRSVANTNMNNTSSRSHAILSLTLGSGAKLVLVDLAGSEVVKKSGASGQTLGEAGCINKSLTSLAMVISALTQPNAGKTLHIPYRSSKLTQVLQDALGGDCKTSLIVNCSSSPEHMAETISSLRFGSRSKLITNKFPSREERARVEALRQWKIDIDKELIAWKLPVQSSARTWLDLTKAYALVDERCPEMLDEIPAVKSLIFEFDTQTLHDEVVKDAEIKMLDEKITRHLEVIERLRTLLKAANLKIEPKKPKSPVCDFVEAQQGRLEQCNQEISKLKHENEKLRQMLAEARARPLSDRVRCYLKMMDAQMIEYAHQLVNRPKKRKQELSPPGNKRPKI